MGTKRLALKMVMLLSMMAEGVQAVAGRCELLFLWFVFGLWCGVLIVIFLYSERSHLRGDCRKNSLNDVHF
jgi:hypothetical protein